MPSTQPMADIPHRQPPRSQALVLILLLYLVAFVSDAFHYRHYYKMRHFRPYGYFRRPKKLPPSHLKSDSSKRNIVTKQLKHIHPTPLPTPYPTPSRTLTPTTTRHRRHRERVEARKQLKPTPTSSPTKKPKSNHPSPRPSTAPSEQTPSPHAAPSASPTIPPTSSQQDVEAPPVEFPSTAPSSIPTKDPSLNPITLPSDSPTNQPTNLPTEPPSKYPSSYPSATPTSTPTRTPTNPPTDEPSLLPSRIPTFKPTLKSTFKPSHEPSSILSEKPTAILSIRPTKKYYSEDTGETPSNPDSEASVQPSSAQLFVEADDDDDYLQGETGDIGESIPEEISNDSPMSLTLGAIIACAIVLVVFLIAGMYISRNRSNNYSFPTGNTRAPNLHRQVIPESGAFDHDQIYSTNQFPIYDTTFDDQPSTSSITFSHQSELPSNVDTFSFDALSLTSSLPSSRHLYPRDQNVYPDDLVYDPKDDSLYGTLGIEE